MSIRAIFYSVSYPQELTETLNVNNMLNKWFFFFFEFVDWIIQEFFLCLVTYLVHLLQLFCEIYIYYSIFIIGKLRIYVLSYKIIRKTDGKIKVAIDSYGSE